MARRKFAKFNQMGNFSKRTVTRLTAWVIFHLLVLFGRDALLLFVLFAVLLLFVVIIVVVIIIIIIVWWSLTVIIIIIIIIPITIIPI
eukprot:UN00934